MFFIVNADVKMNRRFTLLEAQKLLPRVYKKTFDTVNRIQQIRVQLDEFGDGTPKGRRLYLKSMSLS